MRLPPWASTMRPATAIPIPVPGFGAEPEVKGARIVSCSSSGIPVPESSMEMSAPPPSAGATETITASEEAWRRELLSRFQMSCRIIGAFAGTMRTPPGASTRIGVSLILRISRAVEATTSRISTGSVASGSDECSFEVGEHGFCQCDDALSVRHHRVEELALSVCEFPGHPLG